jgi:hypothetical protein
VRESASLLASGLVTSLECAPREGTWIQHFRLDAQGDPERPPVGLLRYVAAPDPEGGVRVDLDLRFLVHGVHLVHTEFARPGMRRLVFREVRESGGRTLFLEGAPGAPMQGHELGGPELVRRDSVGPADLPLLLVESLRLGFPPPERASVVDPLGAVEESLTIETRAAGEGVVACEARRPDGSLRWAVRLRGSELLEWRFQDRGPTARAIPADEYERLTTQHELGVRAAREAAAEETRRRRTAYPR